jgi:hypothetical protein
MQIYVYRMKVETFSNGTKRDVYEIGCKGIPKNDIIL